MTDCWRSGLLISMITVVGVTVAPGRRTRRSTRPLVVAVIQRMFSGTRMPEPRTWRIIGPRLTVSTQTVAAIDAWRRRPEPRHADRDEHDGDQGDRTVNHAANLLLTFDFGGARYVDH